MALLISIGVSTVYWGPGSIKVPPNDDTPSVLLALHDGQEDTLIDPLAYLGAAS